jgi:hypothetical protein
MWEVTSMLSIIAQQIAIYAISLLQMAPHGQVKLPCGLSVEKMDMLFTQMEHTFTLSMERQHIAPLAQQRQQPTQGEARLQVEL